MKYILVVSVAIVLTFILISCAKKAHSEHTDESIDTFIIQKMQRSGIIGLSGAVFSGKKMIWAKGYGYADFEHKVPFTEKTLINIASITKTITGVCIMKLVEDNKLSLDEDINSYLPFKVNNPFWPNEKITLRNLVTHTSGIVDRPAVYDSSYRRVTDVRESLGYFLENYFVPERKYYSKSNFLNSKPGSRYEYSNIGAGLAGYIVEVVSGKPLNEYSRDVIFGPLGMSDTGWFFSEIEKNNHSKHYFYHRKSLHAFPWYELTTYPDGGVRTSVIDLSKFFLCILNKGELNGIQILTPEAATMVMHPAFSKANKPRHLNLKKDNPGIFWTTTNNGSRSGHSGSDPGVSTEMFYDSAQDIGVILFVNTDLGWINQRSIKVIEDHLWNYGKSVQK